MVFALTSGFQKPSIIPNQNEANHKDYNSIIRQQTKLKNDHAILSTYTQMESRNILPEATTLPLVIKACARLKAVEKGIRIHNYIRNTKLMKDTRVETALIDFYGKCGFLRNARDVFDEMTDRDLVSWNAMLNIYVGCGFYEEAVPFVVKMQKEGLRPNSRTVVTLLSACEEVPDFRLGKEVHGFSLRNGLCESDPHVGTSLIGFYLGLDVRFSHLVFDSMIVKNVVSWNAMIGGYFETRDCFNALKLFGRMVKVGVRFDSVTILIVVQTCAEFGCLKLGMQIHAMAIKCKCVNDLFIVNALLNMYSDFEELEFSRKLFENVACHDVALWNSMIYTFVEYGCYEEAIELFIRMQNEGIREDDRTIVIMLSLCKEFAGFSKLGKSFHAVVIKSMMELDTSLGNALLSIYADRNCVESVKKIFSEMSGVDLVSYNTLILALARNNLKGEAFEILGMMRESEMKPNSYTIISILASCMDKTSLSLGKSVHAFAIKQGIEINQSLSTALTDMYMNCGDEATARILFDGFPTRDLISWNALIAGYIKNNNPTKAFIFFNQMISEVDPNHVTIVNILSSCTHLVNLPLGQSLHGYVIRRSSLGFDLSLANAIISMYARCGSMKNAENIFKSLPRRNIISWNAMITGYGMDGRGHDAIKAFSKILEDKVGNVRPNGVTFVALLSACSHSGLIDEGLEIFHSMIKDFNITPQLAHYGCVVDLLGRRGCLDEAKEFIKSMPIEPDASIWRALLSAIRVRVNIEEAKSVFGKIVELEPVNAANYILMSNIYAAAGMWSGVKHIRSWLREKGLKKPPGSSWIVVRGRVHSFTAGSRSHPLSDKVYETLSSLLSSINDAGHIPDFPFAFHNEDD